MKKTTMHILPAVLLAAFSGAASAAAFQLWEQNASGLGNAYAGSAAVADNASTIFYNPAGLTQLSGLRLSVGVAGVGPSYRFSDNGSSGAFNGSGDGGNAGGWHALPNLYLSGRLTDDLSAGFGISVPFGLATQYDDNWIGRVQAIKSELRTINFNPALAYRVSDKVSLGLGIDYQKIDAELTSYTPLGRYRIKGDDAAWGWNAGALFTLSPAMRVGVSYRSAIAYTLEGTRSVGAATAGAKADIKMPDTFILSVWQQVSDRWEAMGDLSYTRWSVLDRLDVRTAGATDTDYFRYKNAWRLAWGAAYKASEALKLKFGIAYDRSPVRADFRSARVPDNNRLWLSLGAQWNAGRYGVFDAGYAYLYVRDPDIEQSKNLGGFNNTLRGQYDAGAHIVGMQYSVGF